MNASSMGYPAPGAGPTMLRTLNRVPSVNVANVFQQFHGIDLGALTESPTPKFLLPIER